LCVWLRFSFYALESPLTVSFVLMQYPPCFKDIAFWVNDEFTENNFCELVRGEAGDLVEEVSLTCLTRFVTRSAFSCFLFSVIYLMPKILFTTYL
jgi:hypothetical protein